MGVRHYLRVFGAYARLHMKTAMEYRANFFALTFFMLFNDALFILIFYYLFTYFGTINGYSAKYAMLLFGVTGMAYGFIALFFGNRRGLSTIITEGQLDAYLSTPVDELFHALIGKSNYDGAGDVLFGVIILFLFAPDMALWGILLGMIGSVVLLGFTIAVDSLGFFLERPRNATRAAHNTVVSLTSWPIDAYGGTARMLLYLVPFAFVGAVPVHLVTGFSWAECGALIMVAATILLASILIWKWGLRRYESGSMMTTRS